MNRPQLSKTAAGESPAAGNISWAGPAVLVLEALSILFLIPVATVASQLALHPLYGSTTASLHFSTLAQVACLSSVTRPTMPAHRLLLFIAIILGAAPMSAKVLGSWTGRMGDHTLGPVITQLAISVPLIGLASVLLRTRLAPLLRGTNPILPNILAAASLYAGIHYGEPLLWRRMSFGGFLTSCNMFLGLSITSSVAAALSTPIKGSKPHEASRSLISSGILLTIPLFITAFSRSQSPCRTPSLPATFRSVYYPTPTNASALSKLTQSFGIGVSTLEADPENQPRNVTVNLLARSDSVTGTIVVGESVEDGFRFLRADHSILGGRWIGDKTYGAPLGESVYGAFTLQEAVRLVKREHVKESENVLNIGLGIGIAADALIKHGHKVHIVEIDPAVYTYARGFFNLSEPYAVHLVDARGWVHEQYKLHKATSDKVFHLDYSDASSSSKPGQSTGDLNADKFAMVIHDCFSGGGVPAHIFTLEFWEELKGIMTPDGVLAVNFAGHIGTEAARAIWYTLEHAFSPAKGGRGCRVFHDRVSDPSKPIEEQNVLEEDAFLNMVYFCQKDEGALTDVDSKDDKKVEFRRATEADYLRSWLRHMILSTMLDREVTKEQITGAKAAQEKGTEIKADEWILTDANNRLGEWQHHSAVEHWGLMRTVMPYNVWEIY